MRPPPDCGLGTSYVENLPTFRIGSPTWAICNIENMLQHSIYQSFRTDCKNLITMIKEPKTWSNFTTELERIKTLQIYFSCLKITYISRMQNQIADFLAKTTKFFYIKLYFISCFIPVWLFRPFLV